MRYGNSSKKGIPLLDLEHYIKVGRACNRSPSFTTNGLAKLLHRGHPCFVPDEGHGFAIKVDVFGLYAARLTAVIAHWNRHRHGLAMLPGKKIEEQGERMRGEPVTARREIYVSASLSNSPLAIRISTTVHTGSGGKIITTNGDFGKLRRRHF